MGLLKPDIIYLILLLVLPGLLSQTVFNSMLSRGKKGQVDIYQSILHSVIIYIILYPLAVLFLGKKLNTKTIRDFIAGNNWMPLAIVVVIVLISIVWGILHFKIYRSQILKKFFVRFGEAVEPPNICAAIFDERFHTTISDSSFWVTVKTDSGFIEGCVEMVSVSNNGPREIYLSSVAYLDTNRNVIEMLPQNTGIILKTDEFPLIEVTTIKNK